MFFHNMNVGTILFSVSNDNSDFTRAVSDSANILKNKNFSLSDLPINHSALVLKNNKVIEATSENGVVITSIKDFLNKSKIVIAVNIKDRNIEKFAVKNALKFLGKKYNYTFEPNEDGLYCSQLITESFLDENGNRYFLLHKMNFLDEKGEIIPYWVEYYKKYGKNIPQGEYGSHPKQLLLQTQLFRKIRRIK